MIVDDFDDGDRGHVADVDTAVCQARHRIVVGLENEPVRVDEVHRVLTAALAR